MTIGTISQVATGQQGALPPLYAPVLSFTGDSSYATGGTAGFQAAVRTKLQKAVTVLAVVPISCGGYVPQYDRTNDKLLVYRSAIQGDQVATIATADAATQSGSYVQADVQTIATLANAIKTALNAGAPGSAAALAEVGAGANLGSVTFEVLVLCV